MTSGSSYISLEDIFEGTKLGPVNSVFPTVDINRVMVIMVSTKYVGNGKFSAMREGGEGRRRRR